MPPSDAVTAMLPVAGAFDRLGIAYYVGGSVASTAHGYPRSTVDADLVADLEAGHVAALVAALEADYYIDAEMVREAIAGHSCFNVIHLPTMFKVDVFVTKNRPFDREVFARTSRRAVDPGEPESELFLASAEDIILAKLEWYRLGDEASERQWRDVQGVLKMQWQRLDRAYLAKWAAALGVTDLLERAWQEAGGGPS